MPAGDDDTDLDAMFTETSATSESLDAGEPAPADAPAVDSFDEATAAEEKAAETPAAPAQPERPRGPKKPWWDVYTAMLGLTLLAILLGCVFLLMEWSRYGFQTTPPATPGASSPGL